MSIMDCVDWVTDCSARLCWASGGNDDCMDNGNSYGSPCELLRVTRQWLIMYTATTDTDYGDDGDVPGPPGHSRHHCLLYGGTILSHCCCSVGTFGEQFG